MLRRLLYLGGVAITAVVFYHATGWGFVAMFWWTDRYLPVVVPDFSGLGSPAYVALRLIEQAAVFGVAAFLFVAGVFAAFAVGSASGRRRWAWVPQRLRDLLIPYLIWSAAILILNSLLGQGRPWQQVPQVLLLGGAAEGYYFVPLLCQLYVLAPVLAGLARRHWLRLLLVSAAIQWVSHLVRYGGWLGFDFAANPFLAAWTPAWFFPANLFWFSFGIVMGTHAGQLQPVLVRRRWWFLAGALLFGLLGVGEVERLLALSGSSWMPPVTTLVDNAYSLMVLAAFLGFERVRLPLPRAMNDLGSRAYGIYLAHGLAMTAVAKGVYHFLPQLLAAPLAFSAGLVAAGLGLPLILMALVRRSPARRGYAFLFG